MENTRRSDYYDVEYEIEPVLISDGMIDDYFRYKDIQRRKLLLNSDIDQFSVAEIVSHILRYNAEDADVPKEKRTPIILYITSNGGDVDSGFELIDMIQTSVTPVYTVNLAYQYSMGFLIGLAGHKRYAMPNAKFLMHDGVNAAYNSGAKVHDEMEFRQKVYERIKQYIIGRSNLTEEEYDSKFRIEWYLFADEAKEQGFTDYIIGVDCGIEEVI